MSNANENGDRQGLRHEICQIAIIMITFSMSFVFELIWDRLFSSNNKMSFLLYMLWLWSTLLFLYLPITAILLLHRSNFNAQHSEKLIVKAHEIADSMLELDDKSNSSVI